LIVRTPDTALAGGATTDTPAEWFDVGATLAEVAGVSLDYTQFGRSLMPTVADPTRPHRREAFCEHQGEVMLLDERWKGAVNRAGQLYLLFDRVADPQEQDNLAGTGRADTVETDVRLRILEQMVRTQVHKK
jgi:arylsulfatase A-like enzyme